MDIDNDPVAKRAHEIFRSPPDGPPTSLQELLDLAAALRRANQLDDARRLLAKAFFDYSSDATEERRLKSLRDLALCTYKDPDLPADTRLQQAEQMLSAVLGERLERGTDPPHPLFVTASESLNKFPKLKQDLLGIAGAVQKRRWEIYGLRVYLVRSYQYYRRGHEMGCVNDHGYNAINVALYWTCSASKKKANSARVKRHATRR